MKRRRVLEEEGGAAPTPLASLLACFCVSYLYLARRRGYLSPDGAKIDLT